MAQLQVGQETHRTPSWPQLYDPSVEILHIDHRAAVQSGGSYLYRANDVFRFTLYWTLIFYTPLFLVCGTYAFLNLAFPPTYYRPANASYPMTPLSFNHVSVSYRNVPPRTNEGRSRIISSLLVLVVFLAWGFAGAVIGSAVMGFVLAGLFKAGKFNMSTWIPFLCAIIQVLMGLLSMWPSIIDII